MSFFGRLYLENFINGVDQIAVVGLKAWISKDILSGFLFVFLEDLFSFAFSLFLKYRNGFGFLPFNDWRLEV